MASLIPSSGTLDPAFQLGGGGGSQNQYGSSLARYFDRKELDYERGAVASWKADYQVALKEKAANLVASPSLSTSVIDAATVPPGTSWSPWLFGVLLVILIFKFA